ncbi:hypothetical protein BC831DRAFT_131787 [Entophlyctis helioformis]|nr:hypothetical protein BC831DRAFT_131787 [Entophlyctis helioformis]
MPKIRVSSILSNPSVGSAFAITSLQGLLSVATAIFILHLKGRAVFASRPAAIMFFANVTASLTQVGQIVLNFSEAPIFGAILRNWTGLIVALLLGLLVAEILQVFGSVIDHNLITVSRVRIFRITIIVCHFLLNSLVYMQDIVYSYGNNSLTKLSMLGTTVWSVLINIVSTGITFTLIFKLSTHITKMRSISRNSVTTENIARCRRLNRWVVLTAVLGILLMVMYGAVYFNSASLDPETTEALQMIPLSLGPTSAASASMVLLIASSIALGKKSLTASGSNGYGRGSDMSSSTATASESTATQPTGAGDAKQKGKAGKDAGLRAPYALKPIGSREILG